MNTFDYFSVICVSIIGFQLTRFIYRSFFKCMQCRTVKFKDMGKWAVITGATDGLGKAYAEILAEKGLSTVLISRTQSKLDEVANEIATKYNVETKTIAVDYTEGETIYPIIDKQLQDMEIGVLINNVGMSYPHPEYFLQQAENNKKLFQDIINCNILSATNMCQIVMPGMVARKRGVIINISSTAAQIPSPLLTIYSASKAYVDKFSADLGMEYSKYGIIVQSVLPGYVATKMSKIRRSTWMAPSPQQYVEEAIKTVGVSERTTGYLAHTIMVEVIHALDYISPHLCQWFIMRTMENIRKRALRRVTTS